MVSRGGRRPTWRSSYPLGCVVVLAMTIAVMVASTGCSGCRRETEPLQVAGQSLALQTKSQPQQPGAQQLPTGPRVIEIKARPYNGTPDKTGSTPAGEVAVSIGSPTPLDNSPKITQTPPGSVEEEALTKRLTDKLKESNIPFNDKNPPKIYTSNQSISEFSNYYEAKGQRVSRMSIPAAVLIRPLLQDHPELAAKVDIDALDKVTINQVVVEGTGISAADKYIDPDTLQVVDKLFVTDMPADLGK